MKNKIELKKTIITSFVIVILIISMLAFIKIKEYKKYQENYNKKIETITSYLLKEYPNLEEHDLIKIINSNEDNNTLKEYGIDIKNDEIIKNNEKNFIKFTTK